MSAKPVERRRLGALVIALAALASALAPGVAPADTLVDEDVGDFPSTTSTWSVEPGIVQRRPTTLSVNFDGPHGLQVTGAGGATMASGALTVNDASVTTSGFSSAPQTLEFRAIFGADDRQHIGFGNTLDVAPWAIFSTGGPGLTPGLWARTQVSAGTWTNTAITGVTPSLPHAFRIVWGTSAISYFVDGVLRVSHPYAIAASMRPIIRDGTAAGAINVEWLAQGTVPASAVFESRVLDTRDERVLRWGALTTTPGGIDIRTRTRAVSSGSWSAWQATGPGGAILSPRGRYIQYSATLTNEDPVLDRVAIAHEIDRDPPTALIADVDVTDGRDASVTFNSPDSDVDHFECALNDGAFAPCTSPMVYSDLPTRWHTVHVRAIDTVGNIGTDSKDVSIDSTPPTAVITDVRPVRDRATVSFSSPDADVDDYECKLGAGGPIRQCTSPQIFDGLANGPYTVYVRAIDQSRNMGAFVARAFVIDATAPTVAISGAYVDGSQVTVHFASPDADVQGFECSVDDGAFAGCASPATFSGLAPGLHTVRVRARDVAGNIGPTDVRGFGTKSPGSSAQTADDDTAPVIKLLSRRARVSTRGWVTVKVRCPAGDGRCLLTMRAGSGPRKRATLGGGWTVNVPLKLTAAIRRKLEARGRLGVKIQIVARDDAGNRRTKRYKLTLLAPG
jgi:hypothetical protein